MHNQINCTNQTQRTYQTRQNGQTNRIPQENRSYKEIHNSYKKQEIGGPEDLRLVSDMRTGGVFTNVTCLITYLNAQLGEHEKLTPERIAELSKKPEDLEDVSYAMFAPMTPREKLDDFLAQASAFSFNPSPTRIELLRTAMASYLGEQEIRQYMSETGFFSDGSFGSKLAELKNIAATFDYSGMSAEQKVMSIYNRYEEAFGDFYFLGAVVPGGQSDFSNAWMRVTAQFQRELIEAFGSAEKAQEAYRSAQFGNKSNFDIRSEIASKYPPVGEMTLREFNKMLGEMMHFGVDDGLFHAYARAMENTNMNYLVMAELMDKPFDLNWLCAGFNGIQNDAVQHERTRALGTHRVMEQLFGVQIDSKGNASTNSRSQVDFTSQSRIISSKYDNWTVQDYEKWLLTELSKGYEEEVAYFKDMIERTRAANVPIEIKPVKYNL